MGGHLYNLGAVVDALAPAMLGMPAGGGRWTKPQFPGGEPVVEIVGDRATGKTAVLDALYDGYHAHVPTARVDLSGLPYSAVDRMDRERLDSANASPVTNLLFEVRHELSKAPDGGSHALSFPRLSPALLVLTAWRRETANPEPVPPAELAEAEEELRGILVQRDPDPGARDAQLRRWLNALGAVVGPLLPGVPGLESVLQATAETFLERGGEDARGVWWRSRLADANGDGVQRLFGLVQKFRRGGPDRAWVESHLIAALLADIDGSYGYWARRTRHPCLILLDNVDETLRERFLTPFLLGYATLAQQRRGRRGMLPVVFATSLGPGSGPHLTPTTHPAPWSAPERCPPRTWLLRLGIPPISDAQIRTMLGGTDYPASLPTVIGRLSGGRAGSALLLVRAALQQLQGPEPFALEHLLASPPSGAAPGITARLLAQLLPDPAVREQALAVAPALEEDAAAQLLRSAQQDGPGPSPALSVRRLLAGALEQPHWNHHPWPQRAYGRAPLVTDRALRALLLHELRTRGGPERWSQIHTRLAAHYSPGDVLAADSVRHERRYLHHALALGRFDTLAVRAMHHRYLRHTPTQWLQDLNLLAAAPQAFDGFAPRHPPDESLLPQCPGCAERAAGSGVHAAIRQLLATVWRLSAPLAPLPSGHGDGDMVRVRAALEVLCTDYDHHPRSDRAHNAYVDVIADGGWIDALVGGVQAPDLPVD